MKTLRFGFLGVAALCGAQALAGPYPDHPIRLIAPFSAGGGVDIVARYAAKMLSEQLHESVIVENRPGAASNLGAAFVAHAEPDGYTLLLASGSLAVNQSLFRDTGFNATTDFVRIARVAQAPAVLVVQGTSPLHTLPDLVAYGRAHPDKTSFASTGYGSNQHLNGEIIATGGGFKPIHVPYKGGPPAEADLEAGRITYFMTVPAEVFGMLNAGKLRALAVSGSHRMVQLPDVPTVKESGFKEDGEGSWWGIAAPKGTPQPIVDQLSRALMAALAQPANQKAILALGMEPAPMDSRQFESFFREQVVEYAKLIKRYQIPQQ